MDVVIGPLLMVILKILQLYVWVIIISAVMSWLVAFNVINPYNRFVSMVGDFLYRITEPALRPIRRIIPPIGGMDLSPLALIFFIWFLQMVIAGLLNRGF